MESHCPDEVVLRPKLLYLLLFILYSHQLTINSITKKLDFSLSTHVLSLAELKTRSGSSWIFEVGGLFQIAGSNRAILANFDQRNRLKYTTNATFA